MKVRRDLKQGSAEWLVARSGRPTASEFDALVTPKWKIRTGATPDTYLAKKLAEWWLGGPLPAWVSTAQMEQGSILESEAIPWFELDRGVTVERVGLIETDDGAAACSPDGLLPGDAGGIEVKCPAPATHVGYLMAGVLPEDYAAQVHGSLWVSGLPRWTFLSYCRHFPPLVVVVERDEEIIGALDEAVGAFLERFKEAQARMIELNGGPRPTPKQKETATDPDWMRDEVTP